MRLNNFKLKLNLLLVFVGWTLGAMGNSASAANGIADRHVFMLHPGQDTVWGTYMFGINNESEAPTMVKSKLALPKETTDFEPQDGLTKAELKLDADGDLYFEKEFPPGLTLIAIGFKIPASFGTANITFSPKISLPDFSVLAKTNGLTISSESSIMQTAKSTTMSNEKYVSMKSVAAVKQDSLVSINVGNIPQGRGLYWIMGSLFAGLIVLLSAGLTYKTRIPLSEDSDDLVVE